MSSEKEIIIRKALYETLSNEYKIKEGSISEDCDLVESDIIDSLSFIGFLLSIEEKLSTRVDFVELDPDESTTIIGIIKFFKKFI